MNLTIDIGNTHTRMAVFSGSQMLREWRWEAGTLAQRLEGIIVDKCAVACVGKYPEMLQEELRQSGVEALSIDGMTPTPLKMLYDTPQTLGADRLAAAVGAWMQKQRMPLLIVDCGTCITFDYVSAAGEYLGGNISPGETLRLKAMHDYTDKLPYSEPADEVMLIGRNTAQALQAGARHGLMYEINGYVNDFLQRNDDGHVFFTGGGMSAVRIMNGKRITEDKSLVLKGLNAILNETYS